MRETEMSEFPVCLRCLRQMKVFNTHIRNKLRVSLGPSVVCTCGSEKSWRIALLDLSVSGKLNKERRQTFKSRKHPKPNRDRGLCQSGQIPNFMAYTGHLAKWESEKYYKCTLATSTGHSNWRSLVVVGGHVVMSTCHLSVKQL